MAQRHIIKLRNKEVYPITHEDCVLNSEAQSIKDNLQLKDSDISINTNIDSLDTKVGNTDELKTESLFCIGSINEIASRYNEIVETLKSNLTDAGLDFTSDELDELLSYIESFSASNVDTYINAGRVGGVPYPLYSTCFNEVDGVLYVTCGYRTSSSAAQRTHYSFNAETGVNTTLTSATGTRYYAASCARDNYIHIIGGYSGSEDIKTHYMYDISAGTWTTKTALNSVDEHINAVLIDGKIYVSQGYTNKTYLFCYDASTNAWTTITSTLPSVYGRGSVAYNGYIYNMCGYSSSKLCHCIDPTTGTYTTLSNSTYGTGHPAVALVDDDIYIIGGSYGKSNVVKYNITNNTHTVVTTNLVLNSIYPRALSYKGLIFVQDCYDIFVLIPR